MQQIHIHIHINDQCCVVLSTRLECACAVCMLFRVSCVLPDYNGTGLIAFNMKIDRHMKFRSLCIKHRPALSLSLSRKHANLHHDLIRREVACHASGEGGLEIAAC